MSEKIRPQHLERKAILYVRQSSPYQVLHNLESQKLQYAMEARLRYLGWREIEVVDEDLGRSAAGLVTRSGFERMVAEVCLGKYELDLLRQRSVEARREKARRGELIVSAPISYIKSEDQRLEKDPDVRVQQAIQLVFRKFIELGTVRQTLLWFLEHGLEVPARMPSGRSMWKRPVYRSMHRMLTSPVYGGAYAYGKTEHLTGYEGVRARHICRRKPREQWLALIPGAHEGYVSWEEFERIQHIVQQNNQGGPEPGAARNGQSLLAGLLRCRRCGRKLTVRYTGNGHDVLRYSCIRGWLDNGEPRCIAFGGITVDEAIGREVFRVVQPAAIEASMLAHEERARQRDDVVEALERDREAARYAVDRARRQYDAADPENRLVTAELERRWNMALQHLQAIGGRIEQHSAAIDQAPATSSEDLHQLANQLESIWTDPATSARLKKRMDREIVFPESYHPKATRQLAGST
jgi:DNA invertase Pin-like site-specific DNA recombinase